MIPPRRRYLRVWFLFLLAPLLFSQDETSFSPKERISRIRELAKTDSSTLPTLASYLNDSNRDIRVEAVKAIVKIDTERSLTPLIQATQDKDQEVEIRATDGLVNFYSPGYVVRGGLTGPLTRGVRQVRGFFSSRNDEVIEADIVVRPDVADALNQLITNATDVDVRANGARAAGILRARLALPGLTAGLQSRKSDLIFECLVALQKIGDQTAGPRVTFLANDFDDRIQATALETIGVLRSESSASDVRRALTNARNSKVRRAALGSLAMLAQPEDRSLFKLYVADKDDELRASSLEGLGRLREPEDYPVIEQAYNEKDSGQKVHLAAAFALVSEGKVDTSEFSPLLFVINSLDQKSSGDDAKAYLTELCQDDKVRAAVFPLASTATKSEKLGICAALAASHDPDVMPTLQILAKDIDPSVSLAAAKGIKMISARRS